MSEIVFQIRTIADFDKQFKWLAKKFPSIKNDFLTLVKSLKNQPAIGVPLGNGCYKIRLAITSKGKGKSGGARVIIYVAVKDTIVWVLSIYDKSERELFRLLNKIR